MNFLMRAIFSLLLLFTLYSCPFLTVLQWPLKSLQIYDATFLNVLPVGICSKRAVVDKRSLG